MKTNDFLYIKNVLASYSGKEASINEFERLFIQLGIIRSNNRSYVKQKTRELLKTLYKEKVIRLSTKGWIIN